MDPSLRHWGMAKCIMDDDGKLTVIDMDVIEAKNPTDVKRKNLKDIKVSMELITRSYKYAKGADLVCIEVPVGSQSASAMLSYGICVAVVACLKCAGIPVLETTPQQGKLVVGNPEASKAEVIDWVNTKHPESPWPLKTLKGVTSIISGKAEHMADSIIAIYAAQQHPEFQQYIK